MLTDQQARIALKELVGKYLNGIAPDCQLLIELIEDSSQPVPVRGVLEDIRQYAAPDTRSKNWNTLTTAYTSSDEAGSCQPLR